jgi:aspartyl-tRNA(Asn)/glutamyl-tRNA(Gln) amidotransferase subunit A
MPLNTDALAVKVPKDPLQGTGLARFATRFHNHEITAEQTTKDYLARIRAYDPVIGAFRYVDASAAIDAAREIDRRFNHGEDLGPLMGVPVAIKELFSIDGFPFGVGSDVDISHIVFNEGPFVKTIKKQGCVILGNTKTTEFAAATINSSKSMPWNPWDSRAKRVCGGSSHGSAAALAAGCCAFAVGSDTGGSVRLPAALCGVVGLKPSIGIWSTEGVFPLSPTFDTVGTFTWSAADAALVFSALTGSPIAPPRSADSIRLARAANLFERLDGPVSVAIERAVAKLTAAGVTFIDLALPEADEVGTVFGRILAGELVHYLGRERLLKEQKKIDPVPWSRIESEIDTDAATLDQLRRRHRELVSLIRARTAEYDAIVCPTTPTLPTLVTEVSEAELAIEWNRRSGRNTRPGNLFGHCGISVPVHTTGELPVGLQFLSQTGEDAQLLALAAALEGIIGAPSTPDVSQFCSL